MNYKSRNLEKKSPGKKYKDKNRAENSDGNENQIHLVVSGLKLVISDLLAQYVGSVFLTGGTQSPHIQVRVTFD